MTEAKPCALCGQNYNSLGEHDVCRYCQEGIAKEVDAWLPNLGATLELIGRFDAEVRRQQQQGLVAPEEPPRGRRQRDLPRWIDT